MSSYVEINGAIPEEILQQAVDQLNQLGVPHVGTLISKIRDVNSENANVLNLMFRDEIDQKNEGIQTDFLGNTYQIIAIVLVNKLQGKIFEELNFSNDEMADTNTSPPISSFEHVVQIVKDSVDVEVFRSLAQDLDIILKQVDFSTVTSDLCLGFF